MYIDPNTKTDESIEETTGTVEETATEETTTDTVNEETGGEG